MERAAKVSPQYGLIETYLEHCELNTKAKQVVRPTGTYKLMETLQGCLHWKAADQANGLRGSTVGRGELSLVGPLYSNPDIARTSTGEWLWIDEVLGEDAFGVAVNYRVKRWTGDPPVIHFPTYG